MTSLVLLKRGKNDGIAVYVPKETVLKEMAAGIKLSEHFFFYLVQELSNSISYIQIHTFSCLHAPKRNLNYIPSGYNAVH
jgi:hypothetical protein